MASENILLTFGQGVKSPLGELRTVPRKVTSLIAAISNAPGHEAWWSAHVWAENYRTQGNWLRCGAVVIDVDHHAGLDTKGRPLKHSPAPDAAALALLGAAAGPWAERWSFIHTTPRGARIGWLLADDLIDARPRLDRKEMEIKADRAGALRAHIAGVALARAMVTGLIADGWSGVYIVDEKASLDMARLYWAPYSQGRTPLLGVHAGREALWTLDEMEGLGSSLGAFRDPGRDGGRRLSPMELESQALAKIALSENGTELELAEALEKRPAEGPGDGSLELIQCARFAIGLGVADAATFVRVAESWNTKRSTPWSEGDLATRFEDALARWMGEGLAVGVPAGRYTRPGLTKVLREDRSFKGTLSFDNLSQVTLWREPRETGVAEDQKLTEELLVHAEGTICSRYGWPVIPKDALWSGLAAEAKVRAFDPIQLYLTALAPWDGVERLSGAVRGLVDALAVLQPDRELGATYLRKALIAAVARAVQPGCKVDHVPVLVGPDRALKSSAIRALAGDWYGDGPLDLEHKDALMRIRGVWIFELSEIDGIARRSDVARMKSFITTQVDCYRAPYERTVTEAPRRTVFWGTSNSDSLIYDSTSNRRFWIMEVERRLDLDWIRKWRDQLWAEALTRYAGGEVWWLGEAEEQARERENEAYRAPDAAEDHVENVLDLLSKKDGFCGRISNSEFWAALGVDPNKTQGFVLKQYTQAMRKFGYAQQRPHIESGKRKRFWVREKG